MTYSAFATENDFFNAENVTVLALTPLAGRVLKECSLVDTKANTVNNNTYGVTGAALLFLGGGLQKQKSIGE